MDKEELFSKLNIKDYNNQLENILENKSFSEGTKNILLNILYKMETAYEDYAKIKVDTKLKKELLQEIIDIIQNNCKEIEIVKPKIDEETKLGDKKSIIEKERQKIISYPNEKTVFYALYHLENNKFIINDNYDIIKEAMENLLNQGYIMDRQEIIRDFDGWTWNIVSEEIENYIYNIIYQNIKMLLGEGFIQNYINNVSSVDFIYEFEEKIKSKYTEEIASNIIILIYQIAILENIKDNKEKQENLLILKENLKQELELMENKKEYLQKISNEKKIIGKEIKKIDEILNNNKLLREKFILENSKLDKKIFSLSEYVEILQEKRKNLLQKLEEYSNIMKPMNYVKRKTELSKKVQILTEINTDADFTKEINILIIELEENILKAFAEKINKVETKKQIMQCLYWMRYYKLLYINSEEQIKDISSLSNELIKTEKFLITKACKLKAINILCQDIEKNYELISKILSYNIIDLEDVSLEFKKHEKNILLNIFEDNAIEDSIIYDGKEELNVKFNKKIRLFN